MTTLEVWLVVTAIAAIATGGSAWLLPRHGVSRRSGARVVLVVVACAAGLAFVVAAGIALVQLIVGFLIRAFFANHPLQF